MRSINPATDQLIREYQELTQSEINDKLTLSQQAFKNWKDTSFEYRAELMQKVSEVLRKNCDKYAKLMTDEMGKLISSGIAEVNKCARVCEYYTKNAKQFLVEEHIQTEASESFICYNPLGTILAVMPWNFPFWQVFRFAAPALMAGNTAVLKHASNVQGCALAIEEIFQEAGFPEGVFQTLLIGSDKVKPVIEDHRISAVTLTGSTPAGKAVAAAAGSVIKKCVLELGGSDPYLILADADLDRTIEACVTSKLINAGQSCIAAKRFIVVEEVLEEFTEKFLQKMKVQKLGDPNDDKTTIGPMARCDLRDELHNQVITTIEQGAECILGGFMPEIPGAYYPPTILTKVTKGMLAYSEEIFGPVAVILSVKDETEAIQVANDTSFGLGAAVFTQNIEKGRRIASELIETGCCFVNDFVKSDPRLPFGGIKESGFGRELSHLGIREFMNVKTVVLK